MKNNRTKKALSGFSKRNTHKRASKERAKRALLRAVEQTGVGTDSLKLSYAYDLGRRGRKSEKMHRDESLGRGVFSSSKSGFGFVSLDEGYEKDIFIPEDKTLGAIDGDLVEIIYHVYNNRFGEEKTEGRVKKILQYGRKTVIGTLQRDFYAQRGKKIGPNRYTVIPDDNKITIRPVLLDTAGAAEGEKVEVRLDRSSSYPVMAEVVRNFGNTYSKTANYEAILAECEIPVDFTPEELCEAEFFASMPVNDEGRVRLTRDIIFTIDGAGAKDLDDAVSLKRLPGGSWQLGVHIADVSYYVKERTHLDRAAMARGTSVYFTDKVVPMLPPSLSNGACSLNAGEEKYTLSAIINLSAEGKILSAKLLPTIIKSRVRGVYEEVNRIFLGDADGEILRKYKEVIPTLNKMHALYKVLKSRSEARGALELEVGEAEVILDEGGTPCDIIRRERGDAERMIEQFMLCANEAVATLLTEKKIPCVYRVHEEPPKEKLSEFLTFAHNLGFDTSVISREKACAKDFSALLSAAEKREF